MKALQALIALSFCAVAWGGSPAHTDDSATSNSSLEAASATTNVANIRFQAVSGNWTNSTPCNTTFFDENTGYLKCDGFTDWTGDFTGSSHYFFHGFVNLTTGDIFGLLNETFTGEGLGEKRSHTSENRGKAPDSHLSKNAGVSIPYRRSKVVQQAWEAASRRRANAR